MSCNRCNNRSLGRRPKNFVQCEYTKLDSQGMPIETKNKCIPVLFNDPNKYRFSKLEVPFRVQFPDEDSCKKAILLPGVKIGCDEVKNRLKNTKAYQDGEIEDCFNCSAENVSNYSMENYSCESKKSTYLALENCWQNQQQFQL